MLGNTNAVANLAVTDLSRARHFYENVVGLIPVGSQADELVVFKTGQTVINVYRSQYAGSNKATAVTWSVGSNLESIVRALKAKEVRFEHYDMPHTKLDGDIHVMGDMKVAWFKDPDGNLLNLTNQ